MRVLIVDDEPLARRRLARMLGRLAVVTAIGEAGDGFEALAVADDYDVLLLDIHLPGLDGLQVAERAEAPAVIFTTAYEQHALEAFDVSAVDYLVKPVEAARLERALGRVVLRRPEPPRIAVRGHDGLHLVDPHRVDSFRAADKVTVFEVEGQEHVIDTSLAALEATLPGLVRIHRSELVRVAAIARLGTDDEGAWVDLADGRRARVSRRYLPEVRRRLR